MDVILLENIQNLGGLGDLVSVKPGYARNFLVPLRQSRMGHGRRPGQG